MKDNLFGKTVAFKNHLVRLRVHEKRYWKSTGYNKDITIIGIVIGVHTLWNGKVIYESYDYGYNAIFIPENSIKAYLVAIDLRTNPLYVSVDDILSK